MIRDGNRRGAPSALSSMYNNRDVSITERRMNLRKVLSLSSSRCDYVPFSYYFVKLPHGCRNRRTGPDIYSVNKVLARCVQVARVVAALTNGGFLLLMAAIHHESFVGHSLPSL